MPKQFQYQEIAWVPFYTPTPNAEGASMDMVQVMPSNRLSADLYQQFVGPVFPVPAVVTPLVEQSWLPHFPDYFPAKRMIQEAFGQFVPFIMTPPIPPPPGGMSSNSFVLTYVPTNALPIA